MDDPFVTVSRTKKQKTAAFYDALKSLGYDPANLNKGDKSVTINGIKFTANDFMKSESKAGDLYEYTFDKVSILDKISKDLIKPRDLEEIKEDKEPEILKDKEEIVDENKEPVKNKVLTIEDLEAFINGLNTVVDDKKKIDDINQLVPTVTTKKELQQKMLENGFDLFKTKLDQYEVGTNMAIINMIRYGLDKDGKVTTEENEKIDIDISSLLQAKTPEERQTKTKEILKKLANKNKKVQFDAQSIDDRIKKLKNFASQNTKTILEKKKHSLPIQKNLQPDLIADKQGILNGEGAIWRPSWAPTDGIPDWWDGSMTYSDGSASFSYPWTHAKNKEFYGNDYLEKATKTKTGGAIDPMTVLTIANTVYDTVIKPGIAEKTAYRNQIKKTTPEEIATNLGLNEEQIQGYAEGLARQEDRQQIREQLEKDPSSTLSKVTKFIKARKGKGTEPKEKKTKKPNRYANFTKKMMPGLKDYKPAEKMKKIGQMWKGLSEAEKAKYL